MAEGYQKTPTAPLGCSLEELWEQRHRAQCRWGTVRCQLVKGRDEASPHVSRVGLAGPELLEVVAPICSGSHHQASPTLDQPGPWLPRTHQVLRWSRATLLPELPPNLEGERWMVVAAHLQLNWDPVPLPTDWLW